MSCHQCQFVCMLTYRYKYFSFAEQVGFKPVHTVRNVAGRGRIITGTTESSQIYFKQCVHTLRHRQAPASKVPRDVLMCRVRYCLSVAEHSWVRRFDAGLIFFCSLRILGQIVGTLMVCYLPVSLHIPLSGNVADLHLGYARFKHLPTALTAKFLQSL
jgi:hypothetical protein